eukprot:gene24655-biopygen8956
MEPQTQGTPIRISCAFSRECAWPEWGQGCFADGGPSGGGKCHTTTGQGRRVPASAIPCHHTNSLCLRAGQRGEGAVTPRAGGGAARGDVARRGSPQHGMYGIRQPYMFDCKRPPRLRCACSGRAAGCTVRYLEKLAGTTRKQLELILQIYWHGGKLRHG